MRIRLLPSTVVAAAVVLLASGCGTAQAGTAPVGAGSPAPSRTTATPTPLVPPSAVPGEVTRSVFDGAVRAPAAPMPAEGQLAVDVACSGVDGSTMSWSLESGDGDSLGLSGEADCGGPQTTSWLGITAERRPDRVRVRLVPAPGVVGGYAVVRRGTP